MAIQLWSFPVQWSEPFTVTYSFRTEIISSDSGKEQRRALRASARRRFEFGVMLHGGKLDAFQSFLSTAQRNTVMVPEPTQSLRIAEPIAPGDTQLTLMLDYPSQTVPWAQEGKYVALTGRNRAQVLQIIAVSVSGVILSFGESILDPWPEGSRVGPAWASLLADDLSFETPSDRALTGSVTLDLMPGQEPPVASGYDYSATYDGRELFPFRFNWSEPLGFGSVQRREIVDYGRGVIDYFDPVPYASRTYSADILGKTRAEVYRIVDFFSRMRGRRTEFLFSPPIKAPLTLAAPVPQNQTYVLVEGSAPRQTYLSDPVLRYLEIRMKSGYRAFRHIISAEVSGDNTRLNFDIPLPEVISAATLKKISWAALARFESDDLTVTWRTDSVATVNAVVRTLEYAEPEGVVEFDEGTKWLLDYYGSAFTETEIMDPLAYEMRVRLPHFASVDP